MLQLQQPYAPYVGSAPHWVQIPPPTPPQTRPLYQTSAVLSLAPPAASIPALVCIRASPLFPGTFDFPTSGNADAGMPLDPACPLRIVLYFLPLSLSLSAGRSEV